MPVKIREIIYGVLTFIAIVLFLTMLCFMGT